MRVRRHAVSGLLVVLLSACAGATGGSGPAGANPRGGPRDLLTRQQIEAGSYGNLFQAVQDLRPLWLKPRGTTTLDSSGGKIIVFFDQAQLGGVETLEGIPTTSVRYLRYFDSIAATARWGSCCGMGVILVSTRDLPQASSP